MSTVTMSETVGAGRGSDFWRRSVAVVRMHLADPMTLFYMVWGVLAAVFLVNVIIWQFVSVDGRSSGGAVAIYCFLIAVAVLAVARALPFSLGMGSSRRAFLIGTLITGLILSVCHGLLLFVLQLLEKATDGWWAHGQFFQFEWFDKSSPASVFLFIVVSLMAAFTLGALVSSGWQRWDRMMLIVGAPLFVLVMGGLLVLVTAQHWWPAVGSWFARQTPLSAAGWCAVAAVVFVAATYAVLRRVRL